MRNVWTIVKKELKRFFTDKRMLLALFLPGIIIYFIYSLVGDFIGGAMTTEEDYSYKIAVVETTEDMEFVFNQVSVKYDKIKFENEDKAQESFANGEVDLVIYYQKGENGNKDTYEVLYNSASVKSATAYTEFVPILSAISAEIKPIFNLVATDIATEEDVSMFALKMVLPMLIMTMLLSGCLAVAPESIAGEKERGTIATLLITPIKRSFIAIGKVIALSITALSSAIVSFLGLVFSLPKLASSAGGVEMSLNFNFSFLDYLSLFVVILVTVMSFTIILSIISTFAKSVKEATSYALPVMILVIVIGLSGMLIGESTSELMCLIPIYSTVQCISAVFSQTITPLMVVFTVVSDLVLIGVGVYIMTKLFSSEKVMFSK